MCYKILMDSDPDKLSGDVEVHYSHGWKLHGELIVLTNHSKALATGNTGGTGGKGGHGGKGNVTGGEGGHGGHGGNSAKVTTQTEYETVYIQAMVK